MLHQLTESAITVKGKNRVRDTGCKMAGTESEQNTKHVMQKYSDYPSLCCAVEIIVQISAYLRGLVAFGLLLDQLSLGVDCKDPTQWDTNLFIRKSILNRDK